MAISEHEVNYTPSKWCKRLSDVEVLAHFYKLATEITENARKTIECELDIPYDISNRGKYDLYGTNLPNDAPIFVFIHGGYWVEGSKDLAAFAAPVFIAKGIKVITVGYDLCPNDSKSGSLQLSCVLVKFTDIVSQIKTAIEEILKLASSLGSRTVWIAGHSAGAHLAVSPLYDNLWLNQITQKGYLNLLKGIILIGGIYDLEPLLCTTVNDSLKLTKDEIMKYSFNALDTSKSKVIQGLKVIVAVGECDSPIFINEARKCVQKLVTMVDNIEYVLLRENTDHFDIVERLVDTNFLLTKKILDNISDDDKKTICK